MIKYLFFFVLAMVFVGCKYNQTIQKEHFVAERLSQSNSFTINDNVNEVFPLFTVNKISSWNPEWKYEMVSESNSKGDIGTTFKTDLVNSDESPIWKVERFDDEKHIIEYVITTKYRNWSVFIQCRKLHDDHTKTKVVVTHTFLGLTPHGEDLNANEMEKLYISNLRDWRQSINHYLINNQNV